MTLMAIRNDMRWSQDALAARLGISRRTLSYWENGYWLPPDKQRLQVVLAVHEAGAEWVLGLAEALGIREDPSCAAALAPFEDVLEPPPPAPPSPPRPSAADLPSLADRALKDAADTMDVRANALRAAIAQVLAACADAGATLDEVRAALAPRLAAPPPQPPPRSGGGG